VLAQRQAIPTWQEALSTQALVTFVNIHSGSSFGCPSAAFKFLCTMFDSEKFICEVDARPPLYEYNVQLKEYSNREVKATFWAEIGEKCKKTGAQFLPPSKTELVFDHHVDFSYCFCTAISVSFPRAYCDTIRTVEIDIAIHHKQEEER
jgi:hypothetical protein